MADSCLWGFMSTKHSGEIHRRIYPLRSKPVSGWLAQKNWVGFLCVSPSTATNRNTAPKGSLRSLTLNPSWRSPSAGPKENLGPASPDGLWLGHPAPLGKPNAFGRPLWEPLTYCQMPRSVFLFLSLHGGHGITWIPGARTWIPGAK